MTKIKVSEQKKNDDETIFTVTVTDERSSTEHSVIVTNDYYEQLTDGDMPIETLIERSFVFLLDREPKELILPEFKLSIIQSYFPSYEETIKGDAQK